MAAVSAAPAAGTWLPDELQSTAPLPGLDPERHLPPLPPRGQPYGLIGLTIGFILILIVSLILCVVSMACAFGVFALIVGHQAVARLSELQAAMLGGDANALQATMVTLSLLFYAAVAAAVLGAARLRGRKQWRDVIGWHAWHPLRRSLLFWAILVGAVGYNIVADTAIAHFYPPSKAWIVVPQEKLWAALFVGLAVVFAPIAEELLFRGWVYTGLRAKIGAVAGNLVSAALFALAHWEATHLYALAVFPIGLALGFIRERTGSLKASMAFHALYNGTASVFLVFAP